MKICTDCFYQQGSVLTVGLLQKLPACIEIVRDYSPVLWKSWSEEIPRFIVESDDDLRSEFCSSLLHRNGFVISPDIQLHQFLRWQEIVQATDVINF